MVIAPTAFVKVLRNYTISSLDISKPIYYCRSNVVLVLNVNNSNITDITLKISTLQTYDIYD